MTTKLDFLVIFGAIAARFIYVGQKQLIEKNETISLGESKVMPTASDTHVPEGWKTYTNAQYGFSLLYPEDWKMYDSSFTRSQGNRVPYIAVASPIRYDFSGYEKIGAHFLLSFDLRGCLITPFCGSICA